MSIYFSGTFLRSAGPISAIYKQLKLVNLKPVKKIEVQFDPFHPAAKNARDFLFFFTTKLVTNTNLGCLIKTNVVCDRSEPLIKVNLSDSSVLNYEAGNLTVLEILQHFNKNISATVKVDETASLSTALAKSKSKTSKRTNRK